jgi:hypothetical protein
MEESQPRFGSISGCSNNKMTTTNSMIVSNLHGFEHYVGLLCNNAILQGDPRRVKYCKAIIALLLSMEFGQIHKIP